MRNPNFSFQLFGIWTASTVTSKRRKNPVFTVLRYTVVQRCSIEDEALVYYELIVLAFNDELREKVSGDVGPMKELINVKDSGVNDLMMKKGDDELLNVKLK